MVHCEYFRVCNLQTQSHQVLGSTRFCKYGGNELEAWQYPSCGTVESRQRNDVCELDSNWWAGSKLRSPSSAHHRIGTYFLTTEGDKHMRNTAQWHVSCICMLPHNPSNLPWIRHWINFSTNTKINIK